MGNFIPGDKAFGILRMDPGPGGGDRSSLGCVDRMTSEEIRNVIALNRKRLQHLGIAPSQDVLPAPGSMVQPGRWALTFRPANSGKGETSRLAISGDDLLPEVYLIFADEFLLHAYRPRSDNIMALFTKNGIVPGAALTIVSRSGILRHEDGSDYRVLGETDCPAEPGNDNPATSLRHVVKSGQYINKKSMLTKPQFTSAFMKRSYVEVYRQLNEQLTALCSYVPFISHGTLLGLVRSGDFIPNDDDFDCAYISRHETCEAVSRERFQIVDALRAAGVECNLGATGHIKVRSGKTVVDLMPAWFEESRFNVAGYTCVELSRESFLPLRPLRFMDEELMIPAEPEHFLAANYGEGWRVPDPFYRNRLSERALSHRKIFVSDQKEHRSKYG